jgi:hypothetical protein
LARILAVRRLGLLGVALEIELLVVADAALAAGHIEPAVVQALRVEAFHAALLLVALAREPVRIVAVPLARHARRDGVVAARFDPRVVGRVGEE